MWDAIFTLGNGYQFGYDLPVKIKQFKLSGNKNATDVWHVQDAVNRSDLFGLSDFEGRTIEFELRARDTDLFAAFEQFRQAWEQPFAPGEETTLTWNLEDGSTCMVYGRPSGLEIGDANLSYGNTLLDGAAKFKCSDQLIYRPGSGGQITCDNAQPFGEWGFYTNFTSPLYAYGTKEALAKPSTIEVTGTMPVPFTVRFYGFADRPRLEADGLCVPISGQIPNRGWIEVDTRTGKVTDQDGRAAYGLIDPAINIRGLRLKPGRTDVKLTVGAGTANPTKAVITWQSAL